MVFKINKGIEIENPVLRWNNNEITTVKSSFIYKDVLKSNEVDNYQSFDEINDLTMALVKPGEKLVIVVKSNPEYFLVVKRQNSGIYEEVAEALSSYEDECIIDAPLEVGKYIYSISVEYEVGLGIYYFAIEVVDEE